MPENNKKNEEENERKDELCYMHLKKSQTVRTEISRILDVGEEREITEKFSTKDDV